MHLGPDPCVKSLADALEEERDLDFASDYSWQEASLATTWTLRPDRDLVSKMFLLNQLNLKQVQHQDSVIFSGILQQVWPKFHFRTMPKWKRVWAWVSSSDEECPDRHQIKKSHQTRLSNDAMETLSLPHAALLPIRSIHPSGQTLPKESKVFCF